MSAAGAVHWLITPASLQPKPGSSAYTLLYLASVETEPSLTPPNSLPISEASQEVCGQTDGEGDKGQTVWPDFSSSLGSGLRHEGLWVLDSLDAG